MQVLSQKVFCVSSYMIHIDSACTVLLCACFGCWCVSDLNYKIIRFPLNQKMWEWLLALMWPHCLHRSHNTHRHSLELVDECCFTHIQCQSSSVISIFSSFSHFVLMSLVLLPFSHRRPCYNLKIIFQWICLYASIKISFTAFPSWDSSPVTSGSLFTARVRTAVSYWPPPDLSGPRWRWYGWPSILSDQNQAAFLKATWSPAAGPRR